MLLRTISLIALLCSSAKAVQWQPGDWAFACDFRGGDIGNARIRGEDCVGKSAQTSGCTHFTWTTFNGGTCWMKGGSVSKSDAFDTGDQGVVCGIVSSSGPGTTGPPTKGPTGPPSKGRCQDYGTLIELSTQFYEAQRSGRLPANRRVTWRKDSAVNDRGNNGEDLSGGYYDGNLLPTWMYRLGLVDQGCLCLRHASRSVSPSI